MVHEVATIPGDGIGPEVIDAVQPVFDDVSERFEFDLELVRYDWGSERYLESGSMMPDGGLDDLAGYDAIMLGAIGHPDVPDHVTLNNLLLPIRKGFDQAICKRPAILFDGVESPLEGYDGGDIDFVVYRENTEGEYADMGGQEHPGHGHEVAVQSAVFTRTGTERIVRAAFEAATEREGRVTSITKSNAQAHSMVFWDQIVEDVSAEYPDVTVERLLVDAASMDFIRRPEAFDVVVASNLFGDILTDIGAIITGSMGLAPSANINVSGEYPSMFEPVHGSAPDIVGDGVANPVATILSAAMLFDHLGETEAGDAVWSAVTDQLADSDAPRTPDLGGSATTAQVVADLRTRL
ncbi:isocitrate/isopropylmalate dehydrogenase family protein [Natrialba taiwanensis]|uniref:3-isopropylmalate dehydrogenase n=1 Tax=Natrialba taiwanensis DSM 12281 TaxID=1230458 RepID=M0ACL7_9EURY|nr:isocitrate/isopropylmalate family dehydrogenase [Natrialba taiwanensis]ELY96284.1 3-isopropylmalate dehydrogenase [Natrialba taiwanensis DSM 12281]